MPENEDEQSEETPEKTSDEELIEELWKRCESSTLGGSMDDFLTADNDVETTGPLTDKDIVEEVQSKFNESTSTDDHDNVEDDCGEEFQSPTIEKAKIAVDNLRRFFYGTEFIEQSTFQKIDDIERTLLLAISKAKKQTSIRDYFTAM